MQYKARVARMSGDAGAFPESEVNMLITPFVPTSRCTALCRVEQELVGLPGKVLTQDAMRRLRFVVHAASWLHSIVVHRCSCWYLSSGLRTAALQ